METKILNKKLERIPFLYREAVIETMQPIFERHELQAVVIEKLKEDPLGSYGFAGTFGCGKTHFYWALYRAAAVNKQRIIADTFSGLLDDFKRKFEKKDHRSKISAEDLSQNQTRYSLFLDDLDKAKPSEYAAEQLFELINAAQAWGHQIVWTSNLNADDLQDHFDKADKRFGGAIVRRLCDPPARYIEMF